MAIISIIKNNDIFKPFKGVLSFFLIFSQISRAFRNVAEGVGESIAAITMDDIKSIAKPNTLACC